MALHDEVVDVIRDLGGGGATYTEIKTSVFATFGVEPTRGQVAGVLHRARTRGQVRPRTTSPDQRPAPAAVPVPARISQTAPAAARPTSAPTLAAAILPRSQPPLFSCEPAAPGNRAEYGACTLFALSSRRCRWPLWPDGERPNPTVALFCGDRTVAPTTAYCSRHRMQSVSAYWKEKHGW